MNNVPQPGTIQGQSHLGAVHNVANPTAQVVLMSAATEQKRSYTNVFNWKVGIALSIIQLVNATIVIVTDATTCNSFCPMLWCGILFGISGAVGVIASIRPGFATIVTLMMFNIFAQIFCFYLFTYSFHPSFNHYKGHPLFIHVSTTKLVGDQTNYTGLLLRSVSVVQFVTAIIFSSMTCKATRFCCCKPNTKGDAVYYVNNGGRETNNLTSQHWDFPQQQPGYMTTAMRQQARYMTSPVNQI